MYIYKVEHPEMTAAEVVRAAGLDWEVRTGTLQAVLREAGPAPALRTLPVPGRFGTVGMFREGPRVLGVVGDRYQVVQNRDAFAFFDEVVQKRGARYVAAGFLREGARVWLQALLPQVLEVPSRKGDIIKPFLLLHTAHDGSAKVTTRYTPVRVVCENTLMMALASGSDVTIMHTATASERVAQAAEVMTASLTWHEELLREMAGLNEQGFTSRAMAELADLLIPEPVRAGEKTTRMVTEEEKRAVDRKSLVALFETGKGNLGETRWDAYNAVAEFADHRLRRRDKSEEARLASSWFGRGAALKREGLALLSDPERRWAVN